MGNYSCENNNGNIKSRGWARYYEIIMEILKVWTGTIDCENNNGNVESRKS